MNITTTTNTKRCFSSGKISSGTYFDLMRMSVRGGSGGTGMSSIANTNRGCEGPDGGNGGRGGDVYVVCSGAVNGLYDMKYYNKAGDGFKGLSSNRHGAVGRDLEIDVPVGTVVSKVIAKNPDTKAVKTEQIIDLDQPGERILVAKGGKRGLGNVSIGGSSGFNPNVSTSGMPGEEHTLVLELKTLADVGLIGYPNAGKSSLLRALSNATPKVAHYMFTTLKPTVGVVVYEEMRKPIEYTVADTPGLIEGAHKNLGLGHAFLRHIERCKVLLYVLDIAGTEGRDPVEDFQSLQEELRLYNPDLLGRTGMVFCNKTDRKPATCKKNMARLAKVTDLPILSGSVLKNNVGDLLEKLSLFVEERQREALKKVGMK